MKLKIAYLLFIFFHAIQCEKFQKIKEMLQNSKERFNSEKESFASNEELDKSELLKGILAKPLTAFNYHSTITEYVGIKFEDIEKFTNHLLEIYRIVKNRETLQEGVKDLFISDSNDIVVDQILINIAYSHSTFLLLMGEKTNKQKESNWVVIELTNNYILADQISVIKTDTSLWGYIEFEKTTNIREVGKLSTSEIELLFGYFQFLSLQRALEYFNLTS